MIVQKLKKLRDRDAFEPYSKLVEGKEFIALGDGFYGFLRKKDWAKLWRKLGGFEDTPVDYSANRMYFIPHDDLWY